MIRGDSMRLEKLVMDVLNEEDGLTDKQITDKLSNEGVALYIVNNICSQLRFKGKIYRASHEGEGMTNHLVRN